MSTTEQLSSDEIKIAACLAILRTPHEHDAMRTALGHWAAIMPYPMPGMRPGDTEPDHVFEQYAALRARAFEWATGNSMRTLVSYLAEMLDALKTTGEGSEAAAKAMMTFGETVMKHLTDIETRIEALEQPNGGKLGDHR